MLLFHFILQSVFQVCSFEVAAAAFPSWKTARLGFIEGRGSETGIPSGEGQVSRAARSYIQDAIFAIECRSRWHLRGLSHRKKAQMLGPPRVAFGTVQCGQEVELGTPAGRSSQGATFRHCRYLRDGSHHLSHVASVLLADALYRAFLMSMAAMQRMALGSCT